MFIVKRAQQLFYLFLLQTTFMLILLLLAKGWAVTRQQVTKSGWILLMSIWIPYCAFHVVLYVWNRVSLHVAKQLNAHKFYELYNTINIKLILFSISFTHSL